MASQTESTITTETYSLPSGTDLSSLPAVPPPTTTSSAPAPTTTHESTTTTTTDPAQPTFARKLQTNASASFIKLKGMTLKLNARMKAKRGQKTQPGEKIDPYVQTTPSGAPIGAASV